MDSPGPVDSEGMAPSPPPRSLNHDHNSPPPSLCTSHQGRRPEHSETSWGQGKGLITGSTEGGQPVLCSRPGEVSASSSHRARAACVPSTAHSVCLHSPLPGERDSDTGKWGCVKGPFIPKTPSPDGVHTEWRPSFFSLCRGGLPKALPAL